MKAEDFERLFEEHAQALFGFLAYRTSDRATAEDLLADTFERALRARKRFNTARGNEKAWLYSIALNRLRDHARRESAGERALARERAGTTEEAEDPALTQVDTRDELTRALSTLSPEERTVVALRFGADLTVPEIAKVTKVSLTSAEGRVYRALRKLREELSKDAGRI